MNRSTSRRAFAAGSALGLFSGVGALASQQPAASPDAPQGPVEAEFERDYDPPAFKPSWKSRS